MLFKLLEYENYIFSDLYVHHDGLLDALQGILMLLPVHEQSGLGHEVGVAVAMISF